MSPDFGRGDGDPLGGPTLPVADELALPDLDQAKIEFRVRRPGWATQTVVMTFVDPEGDTEAHLMALWRIWHGQEVERLRVAGSGPLDIT